MGEDRIAPLLGDLHEGHWRTRRRAVDALARVQDARVAPLLCRAMREDRHRYVRGRAVESLVRLGAAGAVQPLCEALTDRSWYVRKSAAAALGEIGDARAVPALCETLKRRDPHSEAVQCAAAEALRRIAERQPVPALRAALPVLRERLARWRWWTDARYRQSYRATLERIEAATAEMKDVPLPARAPPPAPQGLPIPAAPASFPDADRLPVPADAPYVPAESGKSMPPVTEGGATRLLRCLWAWLRGADG
jgi:HEAT repeat protein